MREPPAGAAPKGTDPVRQADPAAWAPCSGPATCAEPDDPGAREPMSERTSQTGELPAADAAEATPVQRLLDSLGRLAATAAIYGDGHPRVMTIAAETASWIQSAGARGAAIDVDSALAQDADHSAGAFAGRISRDLDRLGALRAVFLPQVDAAALVEFARFLRRGVAPQGGDRKSVV